MNSCSCCSRGLPSSLLATLLLLTLTVAVTHVAGGIHIYPASLGILFVTAARFVLWLAYARRAEPENIAWSTLFFISSVAAGAAGGARTAHAVDLDSWLTGPGFGRGAGKLPERAAGLVSMALNNCERLTLLINDILDMEKLESEKQRFDVRRMAVSELVKRSLEDNAGFAQSLSVHFVTPEPLCGADVLVDADRFLQVMANLLSNASKFSPAGAAIEVAARCHQGRVHVSVRDHGKGIPPDFQPRIFQKFSQADSSDSRSRAGTGLGLAISRAIVERLGGHIGFDTGPGGTTFYFDLPDADSVDTQTQALQQSKVS